MEVLSVNRDGETGFYLMNSFLLVQVAELNEKLKDYGVSDVKIRENICAPFGLRLGQVLDYGWVARERQTVFSAADVRRTISRWTRLGPAAPSKTDDFHPLAMDAATVFFRAWANNPP